MTSARARAWWRRIGIQRRIMLYVALGLSAMVGLLVFFGLRALEDATSLVFDERLSTARTVAIIIENDLDLVASTVSRTAAPWSQEQEPWSDAAATLLDQLTIADSAFFEVGGVALVDEQARTVASAGIPFDVPEDLLQVRPGAHVTASAGARQSAAGVFGVVVVPIESGTQVARVLALLTAGNSNEPFYPSAFRGTPRRPGDPDPGPQDAFNLEIMDPTGLVVLGIGEDSHPGEVSDHFPPIEDVDKTGPGVVLRHRVAQEGTGGTDHVMGAVPLANSEFTLVLEQPVDVALALPLQVRRRLFTWSGIGFAVALALAWITTKAVVRPTEQLTVAAKRMAAGDLESPISVSAQDEVAVLVESLESMRSQTRDAYQAVEDANRALESRVRERTVELGTLLEKLISAQEEERHRVARELHDDAIQTLGALAIELDRARDVKAPEAALDHLLRARDLVRGLLVDMRRLILDLRPMVLDDMGLIPAIRWYAESRLDPARIAWSLDVDEPNQRLPAHIETALFRIVQEAINNVLKHSEAALVRIGVSFGDAVRIVVEDTGKGFDPATRPRPDPSGRHVGLAGVRERVAVLGGRVEIRSAVDAGTVVEVVVPLVQGEERTS